MSNSSMLGKWDRWYRDLDMRKPGPFRYGNTITYSLASLFLKDMPEVEDWGCGTGGFKRLYQGKYTGIDGSANRFVDKVADLREYTSEVDGIMMRHVLDHNPDWKDVLDNAVKSFRKKFCLVLFTPFGDETKEIARNEKHGVEVPDISFRREDIEERLVGCTWRMETYRTATGYKVEHIYYIEKK